MHVRTRRPLHALLIALLGAAAAASAQTEDSERPAPIEGTRQVTAVAYSPDGKLLASGGWDNRITLRDAGTHKETLVIELREAGNLLLDFAFSPDGTRIVTGSRPVDKSGKPSVRVWDARTGAAALTLKGAPSQLCGSVRFSPDGSRIAAGFFDQFTSKRSVRLWDARTGDEVRTIADVNGPVAFSPDGKLVSGAHGYTHELKLLDTATGKPAATIAGAACQGLRAVAFRSDATLVSGNGNGSVGIWSVETGKPVESPLDKAAKHDKMVRALALAPGGKCFATGGMGGAVKLWTIETGAETPTPLSHPVEGEGVAALAFSPDGKFLASGGWDGLKVWRVEPAPPK